MAHSLSKALALALTLPLILLACDGDGTKATYSILTLVINGKVRDSFGQSVPANTGNVCANYRARECDGTIWRTTCVEMQLDAQGEFDSTFEIQAGQPQCKDFTRFDVVYLYVEVPTNSTTYTTNTVLGNYCPNNYETEHCNYTSTVYFDESFGINGSSSSSTILGYQPFINPSLLPFSFGLPRFGVMPIYAEKKTMPVVNHHLGKITRYTRAQRISKKDREVHLPQFLASKRAVIETVVNNVDQLHSRPELLDELVTLIGNNYAWPVSNKDEQKAFLRAISTGIHLAFPQGVSAELKASLLEQITEGRGLEVSNDGLHASLPLQWSESAKPVIIKLRKDALGKTWVFDQI